MSVCDFGLNLHFDEETYIELTATHTLTRGKASG